MFVTLGNVTTGPHSLTHPLTHLMKKRCMRKAARRSCAACVCPLIALTVFSFWVGTGAEFSVKSAVTISRYNHPLQSAVTISRYNQPLQSAVTVA